MAANPNPYYISQSPASVRTALAQDMGTLFAPLQQTDAEKAAGVMPVSFGYPYLNVFRYMTAAQIADVTANTVTLDVTVAIQNAINSLPVDTFPNGGAIIFFPPGTYKITSSLVIPNSKLGWRLTGSWGSVLQMSGSAFDVLTSQSIGAGFTVLTNGVVDNLRFDGGSIVGTGHLINTQYMSATQFRDLLLTNLATTGDGIHCIGNGATYMHDIKISNIYYNTTTGNRIVYMGPTASDSIIDGVKGNGGFGCNYGIYMDDGSAHCHIIDSHPYNHKLNGLYIGANASSHWLVNVRPENNLADSCKLNGTTNCIFTACQFTFAPANFADLLLVNAFSNTFIGSTFTPTPGVSKYAVNETGTSGNNVFNGYIIEGGGFTTGPPFAIVGSTTMLRASGTDQQLAGGPAAIAAGGTIFITNGIVASTAIGVPCILGGLATQLLVECDTAPGAGQSFTATLMVNGVASAMVATLSGVAAFSAQAISLITISATNSVSIRVVASAGAAASNIRASLIINQ